jgi:hypothetical protein
MRDRPRMGLDQPATYRIKVQGWVSERWAEWVNGMAIARHGDDREPITTLTGTMADQAALLGLLQKLYNLGFLLLEVRYLETGQAQDEESR